MGEPCVFKHVKCQIVSSLSDATVRDLSARVIQYKTVCKSCKACGNIFNILSYFKIKLIYFVLFITSFTFKTMFFLDYALQSALYFLKEMFNSIQLLKLSQL